MKRFLLFVTTLIFLLGGAICLSACSGNSGGNDDGKVPAADYSAYTGDIDCRLAITSDEECPNGEIEEEYLYSNLNLEQGSSYYIVLNCKFHNFNWAQDNFTIYVSICDPNGLTATLQEAATGTMDERIVGSEYIISTSYKVPRNSEEGKEPEYTVIYKVTMKDGVMLTANFEIDGFGKSSAPLTVGRGIDLELNGEKTAYTVNGLSDKSIQNIAIPAYFGKYPITEIADGAFKGDTNLKRISVPEGIDKIKEEAFLNCSSLQSVVLPDSVLSIGQKAFSGCGELASVAMPARVTSLGGGVFSGCGSLQSIDIPAGVTSIGQEMFLNCKKLRSVQFARENEIVSIGKSAFSGCAALADMEIPSTVTQIGESAFSGCGSLRSIDVPSGIETIPQSAFENCALASHLSLPADGALKYIEPRAFSGCESIEEVEIPLSVLYIEESAFEGCTGITSMTLPFVGDGITANHFGYIFGADSYDKNPQYVPQNLTAVVISGNRTIGKGAFYNCAHITDIQLSDGIDKIGEEAFCGCEGLEQMSLSSNVESIGKGAFKNCARLASLTVPFIGDGGLQNDYFGYIFGAVRHDSEGSLVPKSLKTVVITGGKTISGGAFWGCGNIENLTLPDGTTSIGSYAFNSCKSLKSIDIPAGVTSIGVYAFDNCSNLAAVNFAAECKIDKINYNTFTGCALLENIELPEGVKSIGENAFEGCAELKTVKIPASVCSVGKDAFSGCSALNGIYISDVKAWCGIDFYSADSNPLSTAHALLLDGGPLTALDISEGVDTIKKYAFYNCQTLESAVIGDCVKSIGEGAFSGCESLGSITLPFVGDGSENTYFGRIFGADGYTENGQCVPASLKKAIVTGGEKIDDDAFNGCSNLTDIEISDNVSSVGLSAFSGCASLENISLPQCLDSIADYAFSGCERLEAIPISGDITSIGRGAFSYCTRLSEVTILGNLQSIGDNAFSDCANLTNVTLQGSLQSVGYGVFNNCTRLAEVAIQGDLQTIGDNMFYGCSSLERVKLPASLKSISGGAFGGCSSLSGVYITDIGAWCGIDFDSSNANPLSYAKNLYVNDSPAENVTIPYGVKAIKKYAFYNCENIASVSFERGGSAVSIGESAFYGCSNLNSVEIPASVTDVGGNAFNGCRNLEGVRISDVTAWSQINYGGSGMFSTPMYYTDNLYVGDSLIKDAELSAGISEIKDYAFYNCSSLESVKIPQGVTSIGADAFYKCGRLAKVTLPDSITQIRSSAFDLCPSLSGVYINDINAWFNIAFSNYSANPLYYARKLYAGGAPVTELDIPSSVTQLNSYAFYNCTCIEHIIIHENLTSLGSNALTGCSGIASFTVDEGNGVYASEDGILYDKDKTEFINIPVKLGGTVSLPSSITTIEDRAFNGRTNLEGIILHGGITSIGSGAFSGCQSLAGVYITDLAAWCDISFGSADATPLNYAHNLYLDGDLLKQADLQGATEIKDYAFYGCESLEKITVPQSVTSIGRGAFGGCKNLNAVYITDLAAWCNISFGSADANPLNYAHNLYSDGDLLKQADLQGATEIKDYAFYGCESLEEITVPQSVTSIGSNAFGNCKNLVSITLPFIGDGGLRNDYFGYIFGANSYNRNQQYVPSSLKTAVITGDVASISDYAFYSCANIENITLPESVQSLGADSFGSCANLKSVDFGQNSALKNIGVRAFAHSDLRIITIPANVNNIKASAFYDCKKLAIVYFAADSKLETIGSRAFADCKNLAGITIPAGVKTIESDSFSGCEKLAEVINLSGLSITAGDDGYGGVAQNALKVAGPSDESNIRVSDNYVFYDDGKDMYLISYTGDETVLQLPDKPYGKSYAVYKRAFSRNVDITEVIIPQCVTAIGERAFSECTNLGKITLSEGLVSIGKEAFYYSPKFTEIEIPASVEYIGQNAFGGCSALKNASFGNTTGWKAYDFTERYESDIVIKDSASNANSLKSAYSIYIWKRGE